MNALFRTYKDFPIPYRYLLIGGLIGIFIDLSQNFTFYLSMWNDYPFSWLTMTFRFTAFYLSWIILSPPMYKIAESHTDIFQSENKKNLLRWIGWSLGISLIHLVMYSFLFDLFIYLESGVIANWLEKRLLIRIAGNYFASLTYYLLIIAIFFFHIYLLRYLAKEKELNRAKLNALLMQLRPHFLFNTLHSINTLIELDTKAAQNMVTKLGALLRQVIQNKEGYLVRFEEELSFIKNYLDIEQTRFQDRLQIYYDIAAESLDAKVPKLILQPIVENTIKHGISKLTEKGTIEIKSEVENTTHYQQTYLLIHIKDNGPGFQSNPIFSQNEGIGLQNVRARLKQHYQNDYVFSIHSSGSSEGAHVLIKIPYRTK